MLYFIIIPLYIVFFVAMLFGAFSMRANTQLRPFSVYLFAGAFGTLFGFVIVNALVLLAGVAPIWLSENLNLPKLLQDILKILAAIVLFFGPLFGSLIGVIVGFGTGVGIVNRRMKKSFPVDPRVADPIDSVDPNSDDVIEAEYK